MQCPRCSSSLTLGERKGVEIDYCTACRGVWLDAGELDKILDRSSPDTAPGVGEQAREQESWWERLIDLFD